MQSDPRQKILQFLKRYGSGSVSQLSQFLDRTPVTIRHHLDLLQSEEIVAEARLMRRKGPGRAELRYQLTAAAYPYMPRNYRELCIVLLQTLYNECEASLPEWLLARSAAQLIEQHVSTPGTALDQRIQLTLTFMEDRGHLPMVTQSGENLCFRLANCPYIEIATEWTAFCAYNLKLMETLLKRQLFLRESIVTGQSACCFSTQPN